MILITVGSQRFPFDRLLKKVDALIADRVILEPVFGQIGATQYKPEHYDYVNFMTRDELDSKLEECDIVIAHSGAGILISSLKKQKKIIAVPRYKNFGEHVDDHQLQLTDEFAAMKYIVPCYDTEALGECVERVKTEPLRKYVSNTGNIIADIREYIDGQV